MSYTRTLIIGVDAATQPKKIGLCRAVLGDSRLAVTSLAGASHDSDPADTVAAWAADADPADRLIVAIDAPLGWPAPLGAALASHSAGQTIGTAPDALFSRYTDRCIRKRLGKKPLEIGADRIARTAASALSMLDTIRRSSGRTLPLALTAEDIASSESVIEIYPAATLRALGITASGYKSTTPQARDSRAQLLRDLRAHASFECDDSPATENDDMLDSVLCAIAGSRFVRGLATSPPEDVLPTVLSTEGWIWA